MISSLKTKHTMNNIMEKKFDKIYDIQYTSF